VVPRLAVGSHCRQLCSTYRASAGRFPASSQPSPFVVTEDQISRCSIDDSVSGVPADVATTEYGITALSIVRENPLLTELVLEVADVRVRILRRDNRRIAAG
jgi:hypothetical protein